MHTAIHGNETLHHHDPSAAAMALKEVERELRTELEDRKRRRVQLYAAGRILLSALFIVSGAVKWAHFSETVRSMGAAGITDASMLLPFAIAIELVGGVLLAVGFQARRIAVALIGYVGLLTLLVHYDLSVEANRAQALCNLAIAGALLMIVGHGSGAASVDRMLERRRSQHLE